MCWSFLQVHKLKNITLDNCFVMGSDRFTIFHPHISNLTLKNVSSFFKVVEVVTPQLTNLTIINSDWKLMISAPNLTSFIYKTRSLQFSVDIDSSPSLEKVDLDVGSPQAAHLAPKVVDLLQKFYNVRFLTLSLEIIEIISSSIELIAHQASSFHNLQSLRIYPELLHDPLKGEVTIPTEVKNYFLGSSPSATFTMVSRKELRAVRDAKLAQDLMQELRVLLDQGKAHIKSYKAVMKPQPMKKIPLHMTERVTQIESHWIDLNGQIDNGKRKTIPIVKLIQRIKGLLINLPISKKNEMQPVFSSLCAEAETVMDNIVNLMKIECDKKGSRLRVCLHELAAAAKSSS